MKKIYKKFKINKDDTTITFGTDLITIPLFNKNIS